MLSEKSGLPGLKARLPSGRALLLLWLPALVVALAVLLPVVYLLIRAVEGIGAAGGAVSTLFSARTLGIVWNSVSLAGAVTLAALLVALPAAWLTVRTDLPFRRAWSVILALPLVIPSYIAAYLLASSLGPRGLLQGWLETLFGIERLPSIYGFPGALLVLTVIAYPYMYLSLRTGLMGMDRALEEAARSLGQTAWGTFWRVTLPQLRPAIASGSLLVSLYVLQDFGAVALMRYNTFTRAIYTQYQSAFDRSGAAILALVLILITVLIIGVDDWFARGRNAPGAVSQAQNVRPFEVLPLGRWRLPASLFLGGVAAFALFIPTGVLAFWLVRGIQAGETIQNLGVLARNSLYASGLAAVAALAAALPLAVLGARYPRRLTRLLERAAYLGYALPGVVIALALVFFGANFLPFLYQTLVLLVFAYVVLFLPQATGPVQTALLQLPRSLEEAGRSLGRHPLDVFRRVTLPLIRPGLASGAALVFLTAMKELPATLLLSPSNYRTLATSVWTFVNEAFFARAAAPALLLILVSSIPTAFLVLRKRL